MSLRGPNNVLESVGTCLFLRSRINKKVKGVQFLVNEKNLNLIYKVNIRFIQESLKVSRFVTSYLPEGNVWPPQSKFLTGGPGPK